MSRKRDIQFLEQIKSFANSYTRNKRQIYSSEEPPSEVLPSEDFLFEDHCPCEFHSVEEQSAEKDPLPDVEKYIEFEESKVSELSSIFPHDRRALKSNSEMMLFLKKQRFHFSPVFVSHHQ